MFKLLRVPELDHSANRSGPAKTNTYTLRELIGSSHLTEMWQFNFHIDMGFVCGTLHHAATPECHFVWGYKQHPHETVTEFKTATLKPIHHPVHVQDRYGTHHSKIMVLFHEFPAGAQLAAWAGPEYTDQSLRTARIVIHTANMIESDWDRMTQMAWISPYLPHFPSPGSSASAIPQPDFFTDFVAYLETYPRHATGSLVKKLASYDFASITDTFIGSAPSRSADEADIKPAQGVRMLQRVLESQNLSTDTVVAQVSSVATISDDWVENFKASLHTQHLKLIFPNVETVRNSLRGYVGGATLHFRNQMRDPRQYKRLATFSYNWRAEKSGRTMALPHVKTYLGLDGSRAKWFLLTSANMSVQAWGRTQKGVFTIASWECGVLRTGTGGLVPMYLQEDMPDGYDPSNPWMYDNQQFVLLPYDLPLTPYTKNDDPWCKDDPQSEEDIWGRKWPIVM